MKKCDAPQVGAPHRIQVMLGTRERAALALLALSAVVFEVALTRLSSVLLHAALTPVVIAGCLAAFGLGAAFAGRRRVSLVDAAAFASVGGVLALASCVTTPLGFALGVFALPFLGFGAFAGAVYARLGRPRLTYALDVLGGASGAVVAPQLLSPVGDVNTALAATAIAALAGLVLARRPVLAAAPALFALNLAFGFLAVDPYAEFGFPSHLVSQTKGTGGRVAETASQGLSRTDLVLTSEPWVRYLFTDRMYTARIARWDSRAERFADADLERLAALKGLPFRALRPRSVLVLGAGGGFDVTLALQAGARHVDAVEINPAMIRMTREQGDFAGGVYDRPEVTVHHAEARRFVRASEARYDLISLSLMQTEPALDRTTTGFQSWVFTAEAVGEYLDRLAPGGAIAIVQNTESVAARTAATVLAAFERRGVPLEESRARLALLRLPPGGANPFAHLALVAAEPWSEGARAALAVESAAAGAILEPQPAEAPRGDAPTDDRPFFYDLPGGRPLIFFLTGSGALGILLLLLLRDRTRREGPSLPVSGWAASASLGAGFMLLEAGLLSRGQFLLGYPTLAVTLVVGGMLTAAGLAAAASAGANVEARARLLLGAGLVALAAGAEALLWPWLQDVSRGQSGMALGGLLLCLVGAVGAPAGLCLPALLEIHSGAAATVYAANALATVLGASATTLVAQAFGLRSVFLAGALCYSGAAVLAARGPASRRLTAIAPGLAHHLPADAREGADLVRILDFIAAHPEPFDRKIPEGHLTGSALVISAAGDRILLLHHRKLGRWLQPGGHADPGETSGEVVALREAFEETGLPGLAVHPVAPRPLDVDIHAIPAHGGEPAHEHLDLRYLVVAQDDAAARHKADESHAIRWFSWEELDSLDLDPGLLRALAKARRLLRPEP